MNIKYINVKSKDNKNAKLNEKTDKKISIACILLCGIFLIGIFSGTLYMKKIGNIESIKSILEIREINTENTREILYSSLCQNCLMIVLFWIIGLSIVGVPILLFALFFEGVSIGIIISYFLSVFGLAKGYSYLYIGLYLTTIINVYVMIVLCKSAIEVTYNVIGKNRNIKAEFVRHSGICVLTCIAVIISSLIETYANELVNIIN